ncbi:MAG: single-stranded-DNA-specific exonuclease RecJ [Lachnoclostridium edouardi]|uniref:single-stranded-DNA-specific exonuclease RecJ n=1 Tax=Lachnoclostridium edouardi TaxID=1926283 RepID=UPI0026DDB124|nr:single-stranded-DNA-specific exonuclease RecJ [Lachnoclostridium edouardi]MDO4277519.1 single-stranded-DNA-specific exonuclease RecJ [Lachnoclostridium edouardi]
MAAEKWMVQTKRADFNSIANKYGISPVTARIMRNRDVVGDQDIEQYLFGSLKDLYDPGLLKDMDLAVEILTEKIQEGKPIRIIGDYDIDGVCSTYILYTALKQIGAKVDYEIPDRIKDGYGINENIIKAAWAEGIDTLLTCDNGIAAVEEISSAKTLGMTVVVTDHHEVLKIEEKEILPPADAVVDPKQEGCAYPNPEICGAVVAWKLVKALYKRHSVPEKRWEELLPFAAIATVGDVMRLQKENRIIVKQGLKAIGRTGNYGIRKLAEKNNLDIEHLSAYHIGFVIGPCLNAGGRLQTAKLALSLLLAKTEEEADQLARELKELNDERKDLTLQGTKEACQQAEELYSQDKVLVVFLPDCHESLAGIIAGRLREIYQKPALVLTRAEEGLKGSGRSIEEYHMFQGLVEVRDLLTKFGGHPMAAGFSLKEENLEEFRRRLNENARLTEEDFVKKIWIDVPMPLEYISESLVKELEQLEPFGQGNEKPQFAQKDLRIRSFRVMGKNKNVVRISLVTDRGLPMDGLWFGDGEDLARRLEGRQFMDAVYYPGINEYNGNRSLQIVIKNYKLK